ncbi:MAG TPA: hypothetical protein VKZ61_09710 [Thermomicrobiales bacterium]|jgi:hypothetical protein|nr:hypothetical protein [Thermomicrobiales bacterium]
MTALLINGLSVLMLLFFGAMALYPLFLTDGASRRTVERVDEDRVLHISPAPMVERQMPAAGHQPVAFDSTRRDDTSRREAA